MSYEFSQPETLSSLHEKYGWGERLENECCDYIEFPYKIGTCICGVLILKKKIIVDIPFDDIFVRTYGNDLTEFYSVVMDI